MWFHSRMVGTFSTWTDFNKVSFSVQTTFSLIVNWAHDPKGHTGRHMHEEKCFHDTDVTLLYILFYKLEIVPMEFSLMTTAASRGIRSN